MSQYNCEATTVEGFIQQLAVCYVGRGYWFYVTGFIPPDKDPWAVDEKLIGRYGIDISKWARARRKQTGQASVQYLRFRRFFVLLATPGNHRFFIEEAGRIQDVRSVPIVVSSYSVSSRAGRVHVRIERNEYLRIKSYFTEQATRLTEQRIEAELRALPFEPYAPVRTQLLTITRAINRKRNSAGLPAISRHCLRFKRRIYRPFEPVIKDQSQLLTGTG
jgi:hypothetical protein